MINHRRAATAAPELAFGFGRLKEARPYLRVFYHHANAYRVQ